MNVLQHSGKMAEVTSLFGWIYRITVNECRDVIRRQKPRRFLFFSSLPEDRIEALVIENETMSKHIEDQELWTMLQTTLQELEPRYRELVVLRDMEGLSYREIAQITGTSLGLVKSRLFRAREIIGKKIRDLSGEVEYVQ
ncbi:MAG: ECF RNA polymerase sigma factor SigE [bacterium ADurb.Bin478]|nr:MAG: ECF RNA polymerase sigma factor SigE [bacterium ADurb.Bin478]